VPSSHRLAALALVVPLALAACSSGTGGGTTSPTSSSPVSPTGSSSPTDPGSGSPSTSPTGTASVSPSVGGSTSPGGSSPTPPRPEGNPSTVAPPPASGRTGVTVIYTPTTAAKGQKVSILATTDASLAGKPLYIVKMNDGAPRVISTGSVVGSAGLAKTYAVLQRTGVLTLVIPAKPLTGKPDSVGSYPLDPTATLLAQSAEFTVTVA